MILKDFWTIVQDINHPLLYKWGDNHYITGFGDFMTLTDNRAGL